MKNNSRRKEELEFCDREREKILGKEKTKQIQW